VNKQIKKQKTFPRAGKVKFTKIQINIKKLPLQLLSHRSWVKQQFKNQAVILARNHRLLRLPKF